MLQSLEGIKKIAINIRKYLEHRFILMKIETAEKIATLLSSLIAIFFTAFIFLTAFFFFAVGVGLYIGKELDRYDWGFLILAFTYLIMAIILWKFKKHIFYNPVLKSLLSIIIKEKEK